MADVNRLTVDSFVLHHAVSPTWEYKSKAEIAQWFSDNGFARAYGSNPNNWSGLINPYTGGRSYSQAHIAGQRVDNSTPDATQAERDAGFRWIPLVADIWGQICWHAGNWNMNCRSIGIECLGDYRNYTLRDWDARILGAFWRPQDLKLNGNTSIYGHREVSDSSTECPARIMEMRDTVVNYCNNPPEPAKAVWVSMDKPRRMRSTGSINLVNVMTGNVINTYPVHSEFDFNQKTTFNGKLYVRTAYSSSNNLDNGFEFSKLEDVPVVTTKDETVVTEIPFETTRTPDSSKSVGEEVTVNDGVNGKRTIITRVTYINGTETNRSVVSDKTTAPINKVVYYGTKPVITEPEITPPQETIPEDVPEVDEPVNNAPRTFAEFLKEGLTIIFAQKDKIVAIIKLIINKLKKS